MLSLPKPRYYPSQEDSLNISERVAVDCFKGWTEEKYHRLYQVLAQMGMLKYAHWESLEKDEIDAYFLADKSRRKKTKKWQNPDVQLVLTYAYWRRLIQAQLLQKELEQLQTQHSSSTMKEYRLALEVFRDIELLVVFVPYWHGFFGMPSPFLRTQDGLPIFWYEEIDFQTVQKESSSNH